MNVIARVLGICCLLSLPVQELMSMEIELAGVGSQQQKEDFCFMHISLSCVTPQDAVGTENLY